MRVLHVNDEPLSELGGVSRFIERLIDAQEASGVQTRLLTAPAHRGGLGKVLDFWDPAARRSVEAAVDEFSPDVVHLHNVLRENSISVAALRRSLPIVMSVHDPKILGETDHGTALLLGAVDRWVKSPWERSVARSRVTLFAPVSEELTARCIATGLRPAHWLAGPTLLPTASFPPPSQCNDVIYVGRLAADKGVMQLFDAWRLLGLSTSAWRLRVIGDGPQRAALQRWAHELELDVDFAGTLDSEGVSTALGAARLVVLPYQRSLRQASSLVALEAASHSRPIVVGDDPAVMEIIKRLGAGTGVDASSASSLAAAIAGYLDDGERCDVEGAVMAAAVLEHYSPEAVARRCLELYSLARELASA